MIKYPAYKERQHCNIERLGELPSHWRVAPLRRVLAIPLANGIFKKREHWGEGVKIVNVFDAYIKGDLIDESSLDRVACDQTELFKYEILHGDFVFVRSSLKLDGIGKSAFILNPHEHLVFECHLVRGRPSLEKIDPKYLCFYLNSSYSRQTLVALSNQVTMATIDQEKFKSLSITIPPINEQKTIARFLDFKTAQIDALIDAMGGMSNPVKEEKTKNMINLLIEYRSALITNAVTGKIDVRDFKLPSSN